MLESSYVRAAATSNNWSWSEARGTDSSAPGGFRPVASCLASAGQGSQASRTVAPPTQPVCAPSLPPALMPSLPPCQLPGAPRRTTWKARLHHRTAPGRLAAVESSGWCGGAGPTLGVGGHSLRGLMPAPAPSADGNGASPAYASGGRSPGGAIGHGETCPTGPFYKGFRNDRPQKV